MAKKSGEFKFRKHDNIGAAAAEQDTKYLYECFIDNGDLKEIADIDSAIAIVRGRTGAGKSALLERLRQTKHNVITVDPGQLAFAYIANETFISELESLNVDLTPFYKYLWRHVFAIEIFRYLYPNGENGTIFQNLLTRFSKNTSKKKAVEYLQKYSDRFWLSEESPTKEIIKQTEKEFKATLGSEFADLGCKKNYSETEKKEITKRGKEWVSSSQTPLLSAITSLIDELLENDLYIVIDKLDESWVEDSLRYKLMRALIGNVRDFNHDVECLKIIIALRQDLWDTIFRNTQEKGQQEEKNDSILLDVTWEKRELLEVINARINKLVKDRYTTASICFDDLFPPELAIRRNSKKSTTKTFDYLIQRTWLRPRDIISFVNLCIQNAKDKSKINKTILQAAERRYSESRFQSIIDEWNETFSGIDFFIKFLQNRPCTFKLTDISDSEWGNRALDYVCNEKQGYFTEWSNDYIAGKLSIDNYRKKICAILYKIGVIGLKTDSHLPVHWVHMQDHIISADEIPLSSQVVIHRALWRYLGCCPD